MYEHRNLRVAQHFFRYGTEQEVADSASPVRGHEDQVAGFLLSGLDDGFIG